MPYPAQQQSGSQAPPIDFSDLGGKAVPPGAAASPSAAPSPIDFSDLGGKVVQPANSQAQNASPDPSWLDRASDFAQKAINSMPGIGDAHVLSTQVRDWAAKKLQESGTQISPVKTFGYGALRDTAGLVSGATSPAGIATAAATIALPEVAGPALIAHGGYKMATQPFSTKPEDVQNQLNNAAEIVGGAGVLGAGINTGGGPLTQLIRGQRPGLGVPANLDATPATAEMQPAYSNTPHEILDYAQQKGIDLTPAQAKAAPISRLIEAVGERSILGGDELAAAKASNTLKLAQNVRGLADAADPQGMGLSEEQAGETMQQTAKIAQDIAREKASNAYQQLPPELTGQPIDVSGIRANYFKKLKSAEVALANRSPQIASQVRGALEQGANLGTPSTDINGQPFMRPEITFQDLMKVRSDALQDGDAMARAGAPSEVQGLYRNLAKDVDGAMESTAKQAGFEKQWRDANAGWRDYQQKFNDPQSPLYRILNQGDPLRAARGILTRGSAADIEILNNEDMQPALEALKRQVIMDVSNRGFRVAGDGLGGYSDAFLNQLFGRAATKELYLNGELARRMGFQQNPSGTSNVLLGRDQLSAQPSKWMIPVGMAKMSMPRGAGEFLPGGAPKLSLPEPGAGLAASLAGNASGVRKRDPDTGQFVRDE